MTRLARSVETLLPAPLRPSLPWHPYWVDLSGRTPPCYAEYMQLIECLDEPPAEGCRQRYGELLACLKRQL